MQILARPGTETIETIPPGGARDRRMAAGEAEAREGGVLRGGEMDHEGTVAIGNLDVCQVEGVSYLHVFKSCMNNSLHKLQLE